MLVSLALDASVMMDCVQQPVLAWSGVCASGQEVVMNLWGIRGVTQNDALHLPVATNN